MINYSYDAAGVKRKVESLTSREQLNIPMGTLSPLADSQVSHKEVTNYSSNVVYDEYGIMTRLLLPDGYIQYDRGNSSGGYVYYSQVKDHLGSVRTDVSMFGVVKGYTSYYASGMEMVRNDLGLNSPYRYNGKEFQEMHGLNQYDYIARSFDPGVPRFTTVDPLAEKYYSVSSYVYCGNNPVRYVDPDGRDGMVTGKGTKEDPYIITANYYYQNGSLDEDQLKGLNSAIDSYNKSGGKDSVKVKNADGSESYVKYNLSAQGVDNVAQAVSGNVITQVDGQDVSYGNALGTAPNVGGNGEEFGSANGWHVNINPENITKGIEMGFTSSKLIESTYIHEIGHNLGLGHDDKTSIMQITEMTIINSQIGGSKTTYSYPRVDRNGTKIMINRINAPRVGSLGIIRTK